MRSSLLYYLEEIGYSEDSSKVVLRLLREMSIYDDVSLFLICRLVVKWKISANSNSLTLIEEFENLITSFSRNHRSYFHFYCTIYFKTKYSHTEDLFDYVKKYENIWQGDNFLRRQVTCSLARLYTSTNSEEVKNLLRTQASSGIISVVSAATQILSFAKLDDIDKVLRPYLFHKNNRKNYPLHKFLVLCSVLNSKAIRKNQSLRSEILTFVDDPYFLKILEVQYNVK